MLAAVALTQPVRVTATPTVTRTDSDLRQTFRIMPIRRLSWTRAESAQAAWR